MNEIKVTVTYEKPTTSKFDALMAEYEAAKKYADETVAYYKPLADAAEDAKFDAIMEQLETIKEYAKHISKLKNGKAVWIKACLSSDLPEMHSMGGFFEVVYRPKGGEYMFEVNSTYRHFDREHIEYHTRAPFNFIGNWDEWKIYDGLEHNATSQLKDLINEQKLRATREKNRLNNITKGGN